MAWVRAGDTSATHPIVLRGATVAGADSRTMRELYGAAHLLATMSGAHLTDYVVELGHLMVVCGPDLARLTAQLVEAGYLTPIQLEGRQAWRLVDDPELLHLRLREEVEWDRQRKRDNANNDVTLAVVLRDGSACRYCGRTVSWTDRRGARGATYDHINPGTPVSSPEDLVVACKGCNSARKDARPAFDAQHPLRPVPATPYYCEHVRTRAQKAGPALPHTPDTTTAPAPRPSDPGTRPGPRSREQRATSGAAAEPGPDLDQAPKASFAGSGRDGSGLVGPGRGGSGGSKRRRGRRGRGGGQTAR